MWKKISLQARVCVTTYGITVAKGERSKKLRLHNESDVARFIFDHSLPQLAFAISVNEIMVQTSYLPLACRNDITSRPVGGLL